MAIRARDLGIPFDGVTGKHNSITDVPGVEIGYVTKIEGSDIRTGVTAILPRGKEKFGRACSSGIFSLNGNGEMTGSHWIEESGSLTVPILITNTHAVGAVHQGAIEWVVQKFPRMATQWLLPVVAETWDGYLNDINSISITPEDSFQALENASAGPIEEGSVGGGTGMNCFEFKGGSGTASRLVKFGSDTFTVGAFVQANFGARDELMIRGKSFRNLPIPNPISDTEWFNEDLKIHSGAGSVIVVIATNAPLLPNQCRALAKRVPLGLARTGAVGSHFSGDIFIAFSTANEGAFQSQIPTSESDDHMYDQIKSISWGHIDSFYKATVEAVEEAVINSLVVNNDMVGRKGHKSFALPHEIIKQRFNDNKI